MTLFRKTTRFYADEFDIRGLINALGNRIDIEANTEGESEALPYYLGAVTAINILANHDEIRDQSVFMGLFDDTLKSEGIRLKGDWRA